MGRQPLTDWFTDDNWSRDIIPNEAQGVYIDTTAPNPTTVTDKTTNGTARAKNLSVSYNGEGTLTVSDGGVVSNVNGNIGFDSDSTGTVDVTSTGWTWEN
ncbi:hypothetical protein ACQU0X_23095 [Pseudovibrio ascidiaceicola]|uniref:hypothetical protein n=1 Tax=Pseudovibrio ascidiaceicola TaxID=285279 RepID=UPI003D35C58E